MKEDVCPSVIPLDDFAGHPLLEEKEAPLSKMVINVDMTSA
jgi:hypothetical protein